MDFEERYEKLQLDALRKEDYMRQRDEHRVVTMAKNWKPQLVQALTVARSTVEDSGDVLIDGDHRRGAAQYRGLDELWCQVLIGPFARAERARLFYDLQMERRQLKALDKFRALLAAGDPEAIGVQRILDRYQLRFASTPGRGVIVAVGAFRQAWKVGEPPGDALDEAMRLLSQLWLDREHVLDADVILAFARFIDSARKEIDPELLTARLEAVMSEWTPAALLREASAVLHASASTARGGATMVGALRRVLATEVNKLLPQGQQLSQRER